MASKPRHLNFGTTHHIYNRGVLKRTLFLSDRDYKIFIGMIIKYQRRYPIDIISFCIMPNHFHFLIKEIGKEKPLTPKFMQQLQNAYAKFFAKKYRHPGRVFQGTYKNVLIKNKLQYLEIIKYIRENPTKAGLIDNNQRWKWYYLKG